MSAVDGCLLPVFFLLVAVHVTHNVCFCLPLPWALFTSLLLPLGAAGPLWQCTVRAIGVGGDWGWSLWQGWPLWAWLLRPAACPWRHRVGCDFRGWPPHGPLQRARSQWQWFWRKQRCWSRSIKQQLVAYWGPATPAVCCAGRVHQVLGCAGRMSANPEGAPGPSEHPCSSPWSHGRTPAASRSRSRRQPNVSIRFPLRT